MSGRHDPGLAPAGLLLDQLGRVFTGLDWVIPAGGLAEGVPPRAMHPVALRGWLLSGATSYAQRDAAWAAVVAAVREGGSDAAEYRVLAVGLALLGLGGWRRRIWVVTAQDVPDIHADLMVGFLTRLNTIDTRRANIAGRLIDSAIGYAALRYRSHHARPRPVDPQRSPPGRPGSAAGTESGLQACLQAAATRLAHTGQRIHPRDLELIAATRIDGRPLAQVAAGLGLSIDAAYKRRQRAEHRLATVLHPTSRPRPAAATSRAGP
jgi:DNA-directed RNA polymerase specialized sigma24 family protein